MLLKKKLIENSQLIPNDPENHLLGKIIYLIVILRRPHALESGRSQSHSLLDLVRGQRLVLKYILARITHGQESNNDVQNVCMYEYVK